jgi:DNA-binding transcriptional MerR regulator
MNSLPHSDEQGHNTKGYWINELESLGISPKKIKDYLNNGNNDKEEESNNNIVAELAGLVENIKQTMYQEYKTAYSERMTELEKVGQAKEHTFSA